MSYIVTDHFHKIIVQLRTKLKNNSQGQLNLKLNAYKKNNNTPKSYNPTKIENNDDGSRTLTYEIKYSDFPIDTELTHFTVSLNDTRNLADLNEGVTILVDGNEYGLVERVENDAHTVTTKDGKPVYNNPVTTNRFALQFEDNNPHSIRAIYKGNQEIGVAYSNPLFITAEQREPSAGKQIYKLTCNVPKKFKYMDTPNWTWTLTCNGSPVPRKTVEKILPTIIYSADTNSKGQVHQGLPNLNVLAKWQVGKYKIGGVCYVGNTRTVLTRCWKDLEIVKNTPTLKFIPSAGKGKYAKWELRNPQKQVMPNRKIVVTINNKNYVKTTNINGRIAIKTNSRGAFRGQATYKGDKNFNKVTTKFNQIIR